MNDKKIIESADVPSDIPIIPIVVAVVVALLTVIYFAFIRNRRRSDTILMVGLSDAGKTCIFSKLINSESNGETFNIIPCYQRQHQSHMYHYRRTNNHCRLKADNTRWVIHIILFTHYSARRFPRCGTSSEAVIGEMATKGASPVYVNAISVCRPHPFSVFYSLSILLRSPVVPVMSPRCCMTSSSRQAVDCRCVWYATNRTVLLQRVKRYERGTLIAIQQQYRWYRRH